MTTMSLHGKKCLLRVHDYICSYAFLHNLNRWYIWDMGYILGYGELYCILMQQFNFLEDIHQKWVKCDSDPNVLTIQKVYYKYKPLL